MNTYWKLLLIKQKQRGKKGFTLPYLIGSQNHLQSGHEFQNIEDLLVSMVENDTFETCIRYCLDTNDLIFEIRNPKNNALYPNFKGVKQTSLSIAKLNNDMGATVEEIIERLKEKFQEKIDNGNFSAKRGIGDRLPIWGDFSSSELNFIKECFAENGI